MKLVFSMQVLHVYLFLVPEIRKKKLFFLLGVGGGGGGGGGWGWGGHRCNINFSNGQSIGIVLYGMCSHSLYI